jgi:hypothetical protein
MQAYESAISHKYEGGIERTFKTIIKLRGRGLRTLATNNNFTGLVFTNDSKDPCTINVELSTNVVPNASALVGLPTASWKDIFVSPGQSLDVRVAPDERGHLDGVNVGIWPPTIDCNALLNPMHCNFSMTNYQCIKKSSYKWQVLLEELPW